MKNLLIPSLCLALAFSVTPAFAQTVHTYKQTAEEKKIVDSIPKDGSTVELKIGETKPLNSIRIPKCTDTDPPTFDFLKLGLPKSEIVTYADGGLVHRMSEGCKAIVPARVISATGVKEGSQAIRFFGTDLTIVVKK